MAQPQYQSEKSSQYPHIEWMELKMDGILHECVVMKRDRLGNVLFFKTNELDEIDKRRLAGILMDRNAAQLELWELTMHKTLGNGVNALIYFSQLVKQLTPDGKIMDPRQGQVGGVATGSRRVLTETTAQTIVPVAA